MQTFLQILGIIFLGILGLIGLGVLWVAWKVWRVWRQLKTLGPSLAGLSAGVVPPFRVQLKKVEHPDWTDRDQIEYLAGPLRRDGFVDAGAYEATPSPLRLMVLVHPGQGVYAVVNQHPMSGVHLDLVTAYEDGTQTTYCTTPHAGILDQPPFKSTKSFPELDARQLLKKFLAERPQRAMLPVSVEAFPASFESTWAREFDWRIARGGVTDEEIRRVAQRDGGTISDEDARIVRLQWRAAIRAYYQERLQESFLSSGRISAQQWEAMRFRIRFIHDLLDWDDVVAMCGLRTDDCGDDDEHSVRIGPEAERLAAAFPPKEAFRRINELRLPEQKYERIAELTEPIAADVYLGPALPGMSGYHKND